VGSLTANIIHPREIFRPAIERSAAALIIAHNHPSGSAGPTDSDIEITKQLVEAGKIMGIDLLDHLIISKNNFTSILNS
jgi:DNA repair protein RadC